MWTMTRTAVVAAQASAAGHPGLASEQGCQWWNLACQGGSVVVDSGMSPLPQAAAAGSGMLLGEIVKTIDASTTVPLADPGYRHIYYGFLGLAAPLVGIVLCAALRVAALRRDPATLKRAVCGLAVAGVGGGLYMGVAQVLVAVDDWLAPGIGKVTGHDLTDAISKLAS